MKLSQISCTQADEILNLDIQLEEYELFCQLFEILKFDLGTMTDEDFYKNVKAWTKMRSPKVKPKPLTARQQVAIEKILKKELSYTQILGVFLPTSEPSTTPVTFLLPYISQYLNHGIKLLGNSNK